MLGKSVLRRRKKLVVPEELVGDSIEARFAPVAVSDLGDRLSWVQSESLN
jgi:hypothetical protein